MYACPQQRSLRTCRIQTSRYFSYTRGADVQPPSQNQSAAGGPPPRKYLLSESDADIQGNRNVVIATTERDLAFPSGGEVEKWFMGFEGEFISILADNELPFVIF